MLVGCHNSMVTCSLIVNAVIWSLPLEPERFNPLNHGTTRSGAGTSAGGGRRVPLTYRRTKLLSQSRNIIPPKLHGTDDRKTRGHAVDLTTPSLFCGQSIGGLCVRSTSGVPSLERDCTTSNERWGNSVCRRKMWTYPRMTIATEGVFHICSPIRGVLASGIGPPTEQLGRQS